MKKKLFIFILIFFILFFVSGCTKKSDSKTDAAKFKEEYESLNNEKTSYSDENYRTLSISSNNPFVYSDATEIIDLIDNNETFYVYFGSSYCPWCRSVIEKAIEVANKNNIKKIYYVDIWDGFHNEILRDTYSLNDSSELVKEKDGTDEYYELLEKFDNVLDDYTLNDSDNNIINVGEKRIFAPDFIYVKNGKAKRITTGTSDNQKESGSKLTKRILKDEEDKFKEFFAS